jgi:chromosome segregation ATPase
MPSNEWVAHELCTLQSIIMERDSRIAELEQLVDMCEEEYDRNQQQMEKYFTRIAELEAQRDRFNLQIVNDGDEITTQYLRIKELETALQETLPYLPDDDLLAEMIDHLLKEGKS